MDRDLLEREVRQDAAVRHRAEVDLRVFQNARHEHEPRHQADDDRVPERAGGGDERLAHRVARLGGCRHDGSGAETGFVREQAARHAVPRRDQNAAADDAARRRARREGETQDDADRGNDVIVVDAEDDDASEHIERRHERHELFTHTRNGAHAAEDHKACQGRDHDADSERRDVEIRVHDGRDGVHLNAAPDAEGGKRP